MSRFVKKELDVRLLFYFIIIIVVLIVVPVLIRKLMTFLF